MQIIAGDQGGTGDVREIKYMIVGLLTYFHSHSSFAKL